MPTREGSLQFISEQNGRYLLANTIIAFLSSLFAAVGFLMATMDAPPPSTDNIYAAFWAYILFFTFLALFRNILLRFVAKKTSLSNFFSLFSIGRLLNYLFLISIVAFLILSIATRNVHFLGLTLGLFFVYVPLSLTFSNVLLPQSETLILFILFESSLNDFVGCQKYLRKISKEIEKNLKIGNIKLRNSDFVYHCNMKLLKGYEIKDELENIKLWLIGRTPISFDALGKIYPIEELEAYSRDSWSTKLTRDPTPLIKYISFLVIAIAVLIISPSLIGDVLKLFGL
jgi:hypothetical protein